MTDALPIGGTTGHCHESTCAIEQAADYLTATPREQRPDRPLVPFLRERFGLTAFEACQAIREASDRRAAA